MPYKAKLQKVTLILFLWYFMGHLNHNVITNQSLCQFLHYLIFSWTLTYGGFGFFEKNNILTLFMRESTFMTKRIFLLVNLQCGWNDLDCISHLCMDIIEHMKQLITHVVLGNDNKDTFT